MQINYKLEDYVIKQGRRLGIDFAPTRAHGTDAGADLRCVRETTVPAHGSVTVNTGVHVELPPNTKGVLMSKSGLNLNSDIITTGLIDEGYSGSIKVRVHNLSDKPHTFAAGDKITQLVVSPVAYPEYVKADEISGGERGTDGFGSTGAR